MYFRLMFYLLLFVFLVGCNGNVETDQQMVTEKVEVSDFILEVTTPTVIQTGQILKVKGTLTYVGEETVNLFHGDPVIRFSFTGSEENRAFTDHGVTTQLETGETIEVEDEFKVTDVGEHHLIVRTTTLEVNGELVEGIGNEEYIKDNMDERSKELENSKIALKPIKVQIE